VKTASGFADDDLSAINQTRQHNATLLGSGLKTIEALMSGVHNSLVKCVETGCPVHLETGMKTASGRPVSLIIGIGEEACECVEDAFMDLNDAHGEFLKNG